MHIATGFDEGSSDSSNIEIFSSVLHIPIFLSTNAEHQRSPSSSRLTNILYCRIAFSCIHNQLGHHGLLHRLLDKLFDCVEVIE